MLPAPIQLYDLLLQHGIDPRDRAVTLMRHADKRYPLHRYIGTRALMLYQGRQDMKIPVGSVVVAFFGHRPAKGMLLGLWKVREVIPTSQAIAERRLEGSFEKPPGDKDAWFHEFDELPVLQEMRLKLEIHWGAGEVVWRRVLAPENNYEVRIVDAPAVPFTGVDSVSLVMAQLRIAISDLTWKQELGGICGIYLISCERTGHQYVGSASGRDGIWQRWSAYAATGHGGNQELMLRFAQTPGWDNELRLTLLEPLPLGVSKKKAIERENFWKVALGSRRFGMNRN